MSFSLESMNTFRKRLIQLLAKPKLFFKINAIAKNILTTLLGGIVVSDEFVHCADGRKLVIDCRLYLSTILATRNALRASNDANSPMERAYL